MFEKIIKKLQFGSCKTNVAENIDKAKKSQKEKSEEKAK